ncbi:hypothetical protein GCM10010451_61250 [Streptomyces virens]|jgi:hypothetical protein|uniref:Uncharacterized protein n=2 Tax=Streptomyces TaxID=1883 RepID=A0AA40SAU9_9ACTN|nr:MULTISPECIES: hypothetical protein [Streptomyces]MBA8943094.1 hypothetical protein [Streptomyces calvus]MBA8978787.1 hypothetical protein [Streptomyces calvus]MYS27610.1 hypothetical protein [Streptomyces sp. SID7804]GGP35143.1 hypothetical protein GCM10010247_03640 [Streptomyces calvus]
MSESVQTGTGTGSTGEKVKAETSATAGQAKQAAAQVAGTAAEQAKAVVGEARQQAGTIIDELRVRATNEAEGQTRRAADTLRQWADDLAGLAENAPNDSPARSLVAQAADRGHRAADYLGNQGVEGLASDLQGFARRRPGAFLGGALLAGLVVGRVAKAAGAASRSDGTGQGQVTGTGPPDEAALPAYPASQALPPGPPTESAPEAPAAPVSGAPAPGAPAPGAPPQAPPPPQEPPITGTPPYGTPDRPYPEV